MKYLTLSCVFLLVALKSVAQTPSNDPTWQLNWNDEFNYTGLPDTAKWKMTKPWGPDRDNTTSLFTTNGHNVHVNDSFLSLKTKRGSYAERISFDYGITHDTVRRPYTKGIVSTKPTFQYGYIEARMRMPDNYNPTLFGNYINNAFWGTGGVSKPLNIDWNDIDFEIVTDAGGPGENIQNGLECNSQVETPYGSNHVWDSIHPGTMPGDYSDSAHFAFVKTDVAGNPYTNYCHRYFNRSLVFSGGWHIFGYEWLPDQIKMYVDNKLWVRLEGNYPFNSTDAYGTPTTFYPIHKLILPMNFILNDGLSGSGGDTSAAGPDSFSVDVDYFRYYQLIENCGGIVIQSGTPAAYEMVGNYNQVLNDSVALGQTGCGCGSVPPEPPCGVTVTNGRVTVRAKKILLEDGFRTVGENGEFYAHDLDNCP